MSSDQAAGSASRGVGEDSLEWKSGLFDCLDDAGLCEFSMGNEIKIMCTMHYLCKMHVYWVSDESCMAWPESTLYQNVEIMCVKCRLLIC